jgi:hypothetical protein
LVATQYGRQPSGVWGPSETDTRTASAMLILVLARGAEATSSCALAKGYATTLNTASTHKHFTVGSSGA